MTEKQRQWLMHFEKGETPEEAARLAGYSGNLNAIGRRNMEKLKNRDPFKNVRNFWESVMEDEEINIQHRLKASELCLKLREENDDTGNVVFIIGEEKIED